MPEQIAEPRSRLLGTLNALPELVTACARVGGNIAFNITGHEGDYRFEIGVRKGDEFMLVGGPEWEKIPPGKTLEKLADEELAAMGSKSDVPDVFVKGKLYRSAYHC